jgi:hypothetical protein
MALHGFALPRTAPAFTGMTIRIARKNRLPASMSGGGHRMPLF